MLQNLLEFLRLIAWGLLWGLGGCWLARAAFRLHAREELLVGLGVGLALEVGLANFLARIPAILPLGWVNWLSAALVCALGAWLLVSKDGMRGLRIAVRPLQAIVLLALTGVSFAIARGMAIFDDYAHLPTLSIMATGDIPPHFSLDPHVPYGYHYFLLLFSAQIQGVAGWFPWTAWDLGRVVSFALAVLLAALWTRRVTRSGSAGVLGGLMLAFGTGTRWLLALLPAGLLGSISAQVTLLGSASGSGANLADALYKPWAVEGAGPVPFPFAFTNGILQPGVLEMHASTGLMSLALFFMLLLTFNRWRGWAGWGVSVVLLSSFGLLGESDWLVMLAGWGVVTLGWMALRLSGQSDHEVTHYHRSGGHAGPPLCEAIGADLRVRPIFGLPRLPRRLALWWAALAASSLLIAVQGGAWTDVLAGLAQRVLSGTAPASYQTIGFQLSLIPALVSSHLGVLPLFNPLALLASLLEAGPLLLVLPLLGLWGWKALRAARWLEAALAAAALVSLGMLFVQFSGSTGVRNTSRLYLFMPLCLVFAVPAAWLWVSRRRWGWKVLAGVLAGLAMLGGTVLLAVQIPAAGKPVFSYFLTDLDARMWTKYWNRLEPGALVFDPMPSRATTVLGRFTDSAYTWYEAKPAWQALVRAPDARRLKASGFDYVYFDEAYWNGLSPAARDDLQAACAVVMNEEDGKNHTFRRLLDIRKCE